MKFLFLTDTHIRGTSPVNRKDNFLEALKTKLEEVIQLIRDQKIDICLHGGDIFDRPDISPSIVREVGIILRKCPIPIYTVAGNHDIYGHNPETTNRTMLGLLDGLGIVKVLFPSQKVFLEKDGIRVQLTGQPFHYDLDRESKLEGYIVEKEKNVDYAIHLVHGLLLEKPLFPIGSYTLIENIMRTQADVTLVGHYHRGFSKVIELEGKYFVNPGSLMRLEASMTEIKRRPQVVLLNLSRQGVKVNLYKLKSALLGQQVLDETQLATRDYREKKMVDFIQGIKEVGAFKAFNIQEIMEMIVEREGINFKIKEEALARIGWAQGVLTGNLENDN